MDFKTNLQNYFSFNIIDNRNRNNIDDFFKTDEILITELNNEINDIIANSKFNINGYKSIINTTVLSDMFVSRGTSNFYPEVGMIFLKTYMKQLIDGNVLQPKNLVKVFNKNQELIELPYPIVLYLGGLYYFNLSESERNKYIKSQKETFTQQLLPTKEKKLFERIDGIINSNNEYQFSIKKNSDDIQNVVIPNIIMPPIGYGITNNFLDLYNKVLFGEHLNGEIEFNPNNENKPHVLSGSYLGIIKPIDTYKSNLPGYTAIYRSLNVNNYSYSTQNLITELSSATSGLNILTLGKQRIPGGISKQAFDAILSISKKNRDSFRGSNLFGTQIAEIDNLYGKDTYIKFFNSGGEEILKNGVTEINDNLLDVDKNDQIKIINCFIVYSKLKANFLSGLYQSKDALKNVITEITKVTNIKNTIANSDFYYLLSRLFFKKSVNLTSGKNPIISTKTTLNKNYKDLPTLDDLDQLDSMVDLLYDIWSVEKNNLKNDTYSQINNQSTYALYPSCGGFIFPNYLNTNKDVVNNNMIKKNTNRFLWFESNRLGIDLAPDFSEKDNKYYDFDGIDQAIDDNYFSNNLLLVNNVDDNAKEKGNKYIEYYKISHLMDSLDFEKLDEMKNLFKDFVTFDKNEYIVDSYNLKSLILASSVVTYDDITDLTDNKMGITLNKENINLMLIGNSMYHYNFISEYGLGKYLNAALTTAQKTKAEDVCNDFCGNLITVANTSTIGSIRYGDQPELSLHKFQTSPEVLFSNAKNYEELVEFLGNQANIDQYLSRKILFNNQYLDPFTELTVDEKNSIKNLNEIYLYNKLYILKDDDYVKEIHLEIVREFFRFLNIKYSSLTYKHLFRLIRTFTYRCLKNLKYLDEGKLPSNEIPKFSDYKQTPKILGEQTIPGGISKQAFDAILSISKKNRDSFRGSNLFGTQIAEIDNLYGKDTYIKFFNSGGDKILKDRVN